MQIFLEQDLVFLAVPKAGSTAYEAALRPFASIDVKSPPGARHVTARRYRKTWVPFLRRVWDTGPETFAVLRHPLERLESWYRYRQTAEPGKSTAHLTFDAFVGLVLSEQPPDMARIGAQDAFASDENGSVLIDHLFTIEEPAPLNAFLADRFGGQIVISRANVSNRADVTLSPETEARFYEARTSEFALYDRVRAMGHWRRAAAAA